MSAGTVPQLSQVQRVQEMRAASGFPFWRHSEWSNRFPWLVQGTTGRGAGDDPFDLGLAGTQPVGRALDRWAQVRRDTAMRTVAVSRQVHGAEIWRHDDAPPGVLVMEGYDGHTTNLPGILLAVGVADCVPVSVLNAATRRIALVHAGWRGTAAGIVERAIALLTDSAGAAGDLWLHCGPAICGGCYEVGPEVHAAVAPDAKPPRAPTCIDLRAQIAERALRVGVGAAQITISAHCTRCSPGAFFSHRGGSPARQMALLGIREF